MTRGFYFVNHVTWLKNEILKEAKKRGIEYIKSSHWQLGESVVFPNTEKVRELINWSLIPGNLPEFYFQRVSTPEKEINYIKQNWIYRKEINSLYDEFSKEETII